MTFPPIRRRKCASVQLLNQPGRPNAQWRSGLRESREMLPTVYDDAPEQAWPLAERQIVAHLERLQRAGRLEG